MDRGTERTLAARAVELGRIAKPEGMPELIELLKAPSPEVRRLAASAIGKLAGLADGGTAVDALAPILRDPHPQVRQYAVKALKAYGTAAERALADIRDLAANPAEKNYNRRDAAVAAEIIEEALRLKASGETHACQRCGIAVAPDEYARSMKMFQRVFCDHCFDQTATARRNFETAVEDKKQLRTLDGTLVQSDGERRIADWLAAHAIAYRYDARLRIIEGFQIRPDFYLPEYDVYIEYWALDTPRYKAGMYLKQDLYMHAGKRLISVYPADKPRLDKLLFEKLLRLGPSDSTSVSSAPDVGRATRRQSERPQKGTTHE